MVKNQLIAAVTAGIMLTSTAVNIINSQLQVDYVYAISSSAKKVEDKLNTILSSIRSKGLLDANIVSIKKMVTDAASLNAKLSEGATKKKYADTISKIEALILAAQGVNALETSYAKNSKTIGNAEVWENQILGVKGRIVKADKNLFAKEYKALVERVVKVSQGVNTIKRNYAASILKVESLVKEGEALISKDQKVALEKLRLAKDAAIKLQKHQSKMTLIKRINKSIKIIDESFLKSVTVKSNEDAVALKGYYDRIIISPGQNGDPVDITGVEALEINIDSTCFLSLTSAIVGDMKIVSGLNAAVINIEGTKIDSIYTESSTMIGSIYVGAKNSNSQMVINNIFSNIKPSRDPGVAPFLTINCGVSNVYVNTPIAMVLEGDIRNLVVDSPEVFGDVQGVIGNLLVKKGARNLVLSGQGTIEKASVLESGTIISGIKIPANLENVIRDESRAVVKTVMKFVVDTEFGIKVTDPAEEYKMYLEAISDKDIKITLVKVGGKENVYRITLTHGKYSESKDVKLIVAKQDASLEKKSEMNNYEGNFLWKSKNGLGTIHMPGDMGPPDNDYSLNGGYLALQLIDSSGVAVKLSDVLESITLKRNDDYLDVIPDNNREKSDFGLGEVEGGGTNLASPEGGNSVFYGLKVKNGKTYTMAFSSEEVSDILVGVKPKTLAAVGEYTLKITPAHQGEANKFIKISDSIEFKVSIK
ncbi:MAG: hypothetical protein RR539_09605 [Clostridium sp.]|uniref:hypothetical protein n=1 Tax=Clostridium sp. TaxID=1506 RepID=UPI002FC60332